MSFGQKHERAGSPAEANNRGRHVASRLTEKQLAGLSLGEAFRAFVIGDGQVAILGRRLMEMRPSRSSVFVEGQFPGPMRDFHWPLHASGDSIAYRLVDSACVDLYQPSPEPSEMETQVSLLLADQIRTLFDWLASGDLIGVGTFATTGAEGLIGSGQWIREDLFVDVKNSALCEARDGQRLPLWTGIRLSLPNKLQSQAAAAAEPAGVGKARKQIQTKDRSRRGCMEWLKLEMSNPNVAPRTRVELWAEAQKKWPGTLAWRTFDECRRAVLTITTEEQRYKWSRPGPKRNRS
jgi:hypothetical protein